MNNVDISVYRYVCVCIIQVLINFCKYCCQKLICDSILSEYGDFDFNYKFTRKFKNKNSAIPDIMNLEHRYWETRFIVTLEGFLQM